MPPSGAACIDYDRRHGYRGPEAYVSLPDGPGRARRRRSTASSRTRPTATTSMPAVVLEASATEVKAVLANGDIVAVNGDGLKFAARNLTDKAPAGAADPARRGHPAVHATTRAAGRSRQLPQAEAAFVAIAPRDGAILALVGGFDFDRNKFNHVTQAQRQPGSAFKPFIYSAALEKGFSPGDRHQRRAVLRPGATRPAARTGSPRTTTASSTGRCACAPRSPSRRTW